MVWEWYECPSYTVVEMYELYEQLLPTKLYTSKKTKTSPPDDVMCRLCGMYVLENKFANYTSLFKRNDLISRFLFASDFSYKTFLN